MTARGTERRDERGDAYTASERRVDDDFVDSRL